MSKRLFIADLLSGVFLANSRECVRVMGVILDLKLADIHDDARFPGFDPRIFGEFVLLTLDDGTATATLWTPSHMVERVSAQPGENMEIVARLRQSGKLKRWYSDTLIRIGDPSVEALRWMELSRPPSRNECKTLGYPLVKSNSCEAYRLISLQADFDNAGASTQDLALVMQAPLSKTLEHILELQLDGMIYENGKGNFVPL